MYTPPPGNQPQYTPPGGNYVQPGQKRPGAGGCWLWGGLGCLAIFLIVVGVISYSAYKFSHSSGMSSIMSSAKNAVSSEAKAKTIADALNQYKKDNGHYPDNLTDLVPKYLPAASALHSDSDPNTDPTHVSFDYTKPAADAPDTTVLISFHSQMNMNVMGSKADIDQKYNYEINGNKTMDQTQTTTTPDGKTMTTTSHMDMSTGKSTPGTPTMSGTPASP